MALPSQRLNPRFRLLDSRGVGFRVEVLRSDASPRVPRVPHFGKDQGIIGFCEREACLDAAHLDGALQHNPRHAYVSPARAARSHAQATLPPAAFLELGWASLRTPAAGDQSATAFAFSVDGGKFPWAEHGRRFAMMNEPEKSYHGLVFTERYGPAAYIARCRAVSLRNTGSILAPMNAFLLLQGIETVALRIERHVENAEKVARFLRNDRRVGWVNYAGFQDSPYHALTQKYLGGRACSLLTFGVAGGFEAGKRFYDALKLFKRLVNIGDAKSLACHPASTTHRQMSPEEQKKAGVRPEMIRLSVGIEHVDDIIADLDQALHAAD